MLASDFAAIERAQRQGWALGAFSVYNLEQVQAVCSAAEAERTPVLIQAGSSAFRSAGREPLAAMSLAAAGAAAVEVGVHLDHAVDLDEIGACLALGYTSVMFDGSAMDFEQNVEVTRRVVECAHGAGAWVEGELAGTVGAEDRSGDVEAGPLTDPAAAAAFVERTGVDALAVSIGNVHGIGSRPVALDLERLAAIRERVATPLVLHGASGLPADQVEAAIGLGVCKLNVNTELRRAYRSALLQVASDPPPGDDLPSLLAPLRDALEQVVRGRIRAFAGPRERPRLSARDPDPG